MTRDDEAVLADWGGEDSLYRFLEAQLAELCPIVCGTAAPPPRLQVKLSFLRKGPMGERSSGADYEPEEGEFPATIGIFPVILQNEEKLRRVLAHELIHHWEHLGSPGVELLSYPPEADAIIDARFRDGPHNTRWRSGHSKSFISKAAAVAAILEVPLADLLFERKEG
jgi:hypothetical protein